MRKSLKSGLVASAVAVAVALPMSAAFASTGDEVAPTEVSQTEAPADAPEECAAFRDSEEMQQLREERRASGEGMRHGQAGADETWEGATGAPEECAEYRDSEEMQQLREERRASGEGMHHGQMGAQMWDGATG